MSDIGVISYASGATAFLFVCFVLALGWVRKSSGASLILAVTATTLWLIAATFHISTLFPSLKLVTTLEIVRNLTWFYFIFSLLGFHRFKRLKKSFLIVVGSYLIGLSALLISLFPLLPLEYHVGSLIILLLAISVVGLFLVEQLYRNSDESQRWAFKYLCLGLAAMFIYDVYLYSEAMLFKVIGSSAWDMRGLLYIIISPLIVVSVARNPVWKLEVFVSREVVFHTATLMMTGAYLLVMAAAGYYIKIYGGTWGSIAQTMFFLAGVAFLLVILLSGEFRARLKVILNKHFYNYKYDYRSEWLRFNKTLSDIDEGDTFNYQRKTIKALAQIVESPGGYLFLSQGNNAFYMAERLNEPESEVLINNDSELVSLMVNKKWVVELPKLETQVKLSNAWLAIPLFLRNDLYGIIILSQPRAPINLNWEDFDLLKTAAAEAANYLAQLDSAQALAEARQFEAFHRLSAFVVHDLKNVSAQLALIVSNAKRFKGNPEFIEDSFSTVENAVDRMDRMLAQLRKGTTNQAINTYVNLNDVVTNVIKNCSHKSPVPVLDNIMGENKANVLADEDKITDVIAHIVQNAQEATDDKGNVTVYLSTDDNNAIIEIIDTGAGMDKQFIEQRLFKPFDTTKGNAGMGIGVYEAREYIASLEGDIQVKSAPGEGTMFKIDIPLVH